MDMSLPVMDGWEVTRRFKIDEKLRAIPIIALIAHDMRDAEEKARGFGCDGYLAKPIDAGLLWEKLRFCLWHLSAPGDPVHLGWKSNGFGCQLHERQQYGVELACVSV